MDSLALVGYSLGSQRVGHDLKILSINILWEHTRASNPILDDVKSMLLGY